MSNDFEKELKQLQDLADNEDYANSHYKADAILCDMLTRLGYHEHVKAWFVVGKYYE